MSQTSRFKAQGRHGYSADGRPAKQVVNQWLGCAIETMKLSDDDSWVMVLETKAMQTVEMLIQHGLQCHRIVIPNSDAGETEAILAHRPALLVVSV